jgi:glycosyltransferase involved in cell wall biosynthesis
VSPHTPPGRLAGLKGVVFNWRDPEHMLAGGSEIYAWELAVALRDAGADVEFLTSRDAGQARDGLVDGISVRRAGGRLTVYPWTLVRLLALRRAIDFVIDVENGVPSFARLVVPRRTPVLLVMHHVHLDQFGSHFPAPVAWVGRFIERRLMPVVYGRSPVVTISESTRDEMIRRLRWRGPISIVYNGADLTVAPSPPEHRKTSAHKRIVVLGRLVVHKRVASVIEAVAELRDQHRRVDVDIIGRGPDEERLRAMVDDLGVSDLVRLHGYVDEQTKADLIGRARLHVCASEGEGWGQVVLEAAAAGVPTVAYDVPGLRDSVQAGRTGWLLEAGDSLANGIVRALTELEVPGRAAEVDAECRSWAQRFTWADMHARSVQVVAEELGR